jgi:tetratricopeptide (TPR) repeat protein
MTDSHELYAQAEKLKDEGKNEEAIAVLNQLLAEDEGHTLSHLTLAVLYGKVNQHEKAIEHGRRACELDPDDAFGFTAMSVTYQRAWQATQRQEYIQLAEEAMAQAHMIEARRQSGA